jgi:hypothetical protein
VTQAGGVERREGAERANRSGKARWNTGAGTSVEDALRVKVREVKPQADTRDVESREGRSRFELVLPAA